MIKLGPQQLARRRRAVSPETTIRARVLYDRVGSKARMISLLHTSAEVLEAVLAGTVLNADTAERMERVVMEKAAQMSAA